jgi:hypothetical protein
LGVGLTVGWIFEGDRDRFLAAHDFVPPRGPTLPSFQCPFCKHSFREPQLLNSHIQALHSVERPFLLIAGKEPATEDVIRTSVPLRSLEVFNCTELAAGFDGDPIQPIKLALLAKRLAKLHRATIRVRLLNVSSGPIQPVEQEYHLKVIVPDDRSLARADELFLGRFGVDNVDLRTVDSFYEVTRNGAAAEYAEALADYVRAVLLKDGDPRTGVSNQLHHYHDIERRALSTLQSFERPLAKLLSALMRFGLNDFSRWEEATGFAGLDQAYSILGPLTPEGRIGEEDGITSVVQKTRARVFICPVDGGTDTVTRLAEQATELPRWGLRAEERFCVLADQASVDSLDRAKIRALWAAAALRLGATTSAERALRLLDGDPTFGDWASRNLARVEP